MFRDMGEVTRTLILINIGAYAMSYLTGDFSMIYLALWPWHTSHIPGVPPFQIWQLVTYGFLHDPSSLAHIGFNMFALYMFGSDIERVLGAKHFIIYYMVCVVGAAVAQLIVMALAHSSPIPTVGASGGIFGILLAFGMAFPDRRVMLLIPPIPMKAKWFVTIYGSIELVMGVFGTLQGVAHFAHLGGMAAGYGLIRYWRRAR